MSKLVLQNRVSTSTVGGSALTFDDYYPFGEAVELRFTSSKTGNGQFQGIFMDVRQSAANTSTIRGMEVTAQQSGAVAIGVLEGISGKAITRSATTGNITNMWGVTGEITHNDAAYTGTITLAAAVRGKFSIEDGVTYTTSYVFQADLEAITGAGRVKALFGVGTVAGGATARYGIDTTAVETTNGAAGEVVLWAFKGANGTTYYLVHDTDAATVVAVTTTDPTS